jgi:hypothetical protein
MAYPFGHRLCVLPIGNMFRPTRLGHKIMHKFGKEFPVTSVLLPEPLHVMKTADASLMENHGNGTSLEMIPDLSEEEAKEFDACEQVIQTHFRSYFESAKALKLIHDKRLYRAEFVSFDAYAMEKWGWGRSYAHRLVKAAEIVEEIIRPLGDVPLPENESQVRPLTLLEPELIKKAWKQVAKKAKNAKLTTSIVVSVVQRLQPREPADTHSGLSSAQKDIQRLLAQAGDAVAEGNFDAALHDARAAQIRIDVEAEKLKRTQSPE